MEKATYDFRAIYGQHALPRGARQTRLLYIQPAASRTAQLEASLSVCSVDDPKTAFETLSYVWGDQSVKAFTIAIDGHVMPITECLASALRYIRKPDRFRCMWVDAICINQLDPEEKADQVAIMGDIYRRGAGANVWLPGPTTALAALETTVPDFVGSKSSESVEAHICRLGYGRRFRASGWKKSTLRVSGKELHLDGAYADQILAVGTPVRDVQVRNGCKGVFHQWRDMIRTNGATISRDRLARLLCGDVARQADSRPEGG